MSVFVRNPGSLDLHKVAIMKVQSEDIDELAAQKVTYVDTQTQLGATNVQSAIQKLKTNFQGGVDSIYNACVAKGSTPASHSLSDVVAGINAIPTGITPTGSSTYQDNGTYDVTNIATAVVDVPASAVVSGTKYISSNTSSEGTDVTTYQKVVVNVPASAVTDGTFVYTGQEPSWLQDVTVKRNADATNVYLKGKADGQGTQTQITSSYDFSNASFLPWTENMWCLGVATVTFNSDIIGVTGVAVTGHEHVYGGVRSISGTSAEVLVLCRCDDSGVMPSSPVSVTVAAKVV